MADRRIQTTFRIEPDLLKKFKHELLERDLKMTPVIEKLIQQWLNEDKFGRERPLPNAEAIAIDHLASQEPTAGAPVAEKIIPLPQPEGDADPSPGQPTSPTLNAAHSPPISATEGHPPDPRVSAVKVWDRFLGLLKSHVSINTYSTWFQPVRPLRVQGDILQLRVPSLVFQQVLTRTYGEVTKAVLHQMGSPTLKLEYISDESRAEVRSPERKSKSESADGISQLNRRYTFETFVVGKCNEFAHAAARAVAEMPGKTYNPLFLYGGVGVGKTHLMHAIGNLVLARNPDLRVGYVSAEKFTIDVINSLRFDRMISFRERYHSLDVLLLDDIQFFAGKERTQEEFFHTFNALYEQQKQLVISSDALPKGIEAIEERLRSRFEWGLIADIQSPDLESRIAILQKKAENDRLILPDEVAEFLARTIKSNVRELEGALTRLEAYISLTGQSINLETAREVLRPIMGPQEKRVTIDAILRSVSRHFDLKEKDIKSRSNARAIALPRQIGMYIAKQLTEATLPEIGRQFGGKHHTTVSHSISKIDALRSNDREFNRTVETLMESISQ